MSFTYDLATDVGRVRLMIPDRSPEDGEQIFQDAEISAFLSIESGGLKKATALALETIATNEALVLKVVKVLDLQTNGAETAKAILARAKVLREQETFAEVATTAGFDWVEMSLNDTSFNDLVWSDIQRNS